MKGNKKRIAGIICTVIGVLGLPGVSTVEKDRFGYIVVCLAFIAVGGLLIYRTMDKKKAAPPASQTPLSAAAPVPQKNVPVSPTPQTSDEEPKKRPAESIEEQDNSSAKEVHTTAAPAQPKVVPVPPKARSTYDEIMKRAEESRKHQELFIANQKAEFSAALSAIPHSEITVSDIPVKKQALADMPELKARNITRATRLETLFPLVVVDIETTGLNKRTSEIVEVSAIKYKDGFVPVSCFTTLIKPKKPIPAEVSDINHITDEMVADAPAFPTIAASFSEYIRGCNIAGHNLMDFDLPMLFINGVQLSEKAKCFDTLALAKLTLTAAGKQQYDHHSGKYVENEEYDVWDYKLDTICKYYQIYRSDAHRSLSDCYATGLILDKLIEDKTV